MSERLQFSVEEKGAVEASKNVRGIGDAAEHSAKRLEVVQKWLDRVAYSSRTSSAAIREVGQNIRAAATQGNAMQEWPEHLERMASGWDEFNRSAKTALVGVKGHTGALHEQVKAEQHLHHISGKRIQNMIAGMEQLSVKTLAAGLGFGLLAKSAFTAFEMIEHKAQEGLSKIPKGIEALADYSVNRNLVGLTGDDRELTRLVDIRTGIKKEWQELGRVWTDTSNRAGSLDRRIEDLGIKMSGLRSEKLMPLISATAELAATFDVQLAAQVRVTQVQHEQYVAEDQLRKAVASGIITFDQYVTSLDVVRQRTAALKEQTELLERLKPWTALANDLNALSEGGSEVAGFVRRRIAVEKYLGALERLQKVAGGLTTQQFETAKAAMFTDAMNDAEGIVMTGTAKGGGGGRNPIQELREELSGLINSLDPVMAATAEYEGKLALLYDAHRKLKLPIEEVNALQAKLAEVYRERLNPELAEAREQMQRMSEVTLARAKADWQDLKRILEEGTEALRVFEARYKAERAFAGRHDGSERGDINSLTREARSADAVAQLAMETAAARNTAAAWREAEEAAKAAESAWLAVDSETKRTQLGAGAMSGWEDIKTELTDVGTLTHDMLVEGFHAAEEAVIQFARTGKLELGAFAEAFLSDMLRIGLRGTISSALGLPGFQHGGQFMVRGRPGADANLVAFRASNNETVTVSPPGMHGQPGGYGGAGGGGYGGGSPNIEVVQINTIDPQVIVAGMASRAGRVVVMNHIKASMPELRRYFAR